MNGNSAAPIVPMLPGNASVAEALQRARSIQSRAVVEIAVGSFRIHAITGLAALEQGNQGHRTLRELDAIEFGRAAESVPTSGIGTFWEGGGSGEASHEAALLVSVAPPRPRFAGPNLIDSPGGGAILGVVSHLYECPKDRERFSGSGVCDLHDVDLVPVSDP